MSGDINERNDLQEIIGKALAEMGFGPGGAATRGTARSPGRRSRWTGAS